MIIKPDSGSLTIESLNEEDQVVTFSPFLTSTGSYANIYARRGGESFGTIIVSRAALEAVLLKMDALEAKRKDL